MPSREAFRTFCQDVYGAECDLTSTRFGSTRNGVHSTVERQVDACSLPFSAFSLGNPR